MSGRRGLLFVLFAALTALFGVACSSSTGAPVAGMELVISAEGLKAPEDYTNILLEVSEQSSAGAWLKKWDQDYLVPSQTALPTTFTLLAGASPEEVIITVTAYDGSKPVVQRVVQVQVPTDKMEILYMVLSSVCVGQVRAPGAEGPPVSTCPNTNESCQPTTGHCGSNKITGPLPTYVPGQTFDSGVGTADVVEDTTLDRDVTTIPLTDASTNRDAEAGHHHDAMEAPDAPEPMDGPGADVVEPMMDAADGADATEGGHAPRDSGVESGPVCAETCTLGTARCSSGGVETCETEAGCPEWLTTATCGSHQTCATSGSTASCTCKSTQCTEVGTVCQDMQTLATCAKDADECLYVASTTPCTSPQSCGGTSPSAACGLTCKSSCTQGQTSCVSGSLATCTLGGNGCWALGSNPTPCGAHQSCTGTMGSAACTCNTDPTCSAVGNACVNATTAASCKTDAQGCVYDYANTTCADGACSGGVCCTNTCTSGQGTCVTGGLEKCTLGSNGCWAYGSATPCGSGDVCYQGACLGCMPGATTCSGAVPQTCSTSGTWTDDPVTAGQCGAVCNPGATQCADPYSQTCNSVGQWAGGAVAGQCGATCTAGTTQCDGTLVQTCTSTGTWGGGVVVVGQCDAVCVPAAVEGVCGPSDPEWGYSDSAMVCDSSGQWSQSPCGEQSGEVYECCQNNGFECTEYCTQTYSSPCECTGAGVCGC